MLRLAQSAPLAGETPDASQGERPAWPRDCGTSASGEAAVGVDEGLSLWRQAPESHVAVGGGHLTSCPESSSTPGTPSGSTGAAEITVVNHDRLGGTECRQ